MVEENRDPSHYTNYELLRLVVPDFEERFETLRKENPGIYEEIRARAVDSEKGWRPLHYLRGAF